MWMCLSWQEEAEAEPLQDLEMLEQVVAEPVA
jgi:hypothetical protein